MMFNFFRRLLVSPTIMMLPASGSGSQAEESEWPEGYDPTHFDAFMSGWFQDETNELLEGFPIAPEDTVLDVGCGEAPFIYFCALRGAEVICADIDAEKVAFIEQSLRKTPARAIRSIVSDANPLPLPSETVTKIIAMEVLEHVDDPQQFMRELLRVGRPGAQYLITVPDRRSEMLQKELVPPVYFQKPNHVRIFERDEFEKLITDAGLIIERRAYYGFFWSIWWVMFWACKHDLNAPWHPLLKQWMKTWDILLHLPRGPSIKKIFDEFMPKSQAIIARKPTQHNRETISHGQS